MKQRVIYDAVTGIRADYLEQAADCVDRSAGSRRRLRYAAVCCGVLLCAGFGLLRHLTQSPELPQTAPENAGMTQNNEASVSTQTVGAPGTSAVTQTAAGEGSGIWTPFRRTVNADPDKDSFGEDQIHSVDVIWEGRRYDQLPAELYAQYGIAPEVRESELGALIGTVAEIGPGLPDAKLGAQEPTLAGAEVRAYLPAQSRAVIAVQKGGQYSIFVFRGFAGDFAQTLAFYGAPVSEIRYEIRGYTGEQDGSRQYGILRQGSLTDGAQIAAVCELLCALTPEDYSSLPEHIGTPQWLADAYAAYKSNPGSVRREDIEIRFRFANGTECRGFTYQPYIGHGYVSTMQELTPAQNAALRAFFP